LYRVVLGIKGQRTEKNKREGGLKETKEREVERAEVHGRGSEKWVTC